MMELALQVLKLSDLERAGTITAVQQWELNQLRQQMFNKVHDIPLRVSDPFGLLNEETE